MAQRFSPPGQDLRPFELGAAQLPRLEAERLRIVGATCRVLIGVQTCVSVRPGSDSSIGSSRRRRPPPWLGDLGRGRAGVDHAFLRQHDDVRRPLSMSGWGTPKALVAGGQVFPNRMSGLCLVDWLSAILSAAAAVNCWLLSQMSAMSSSVALATRVGEMLSISVGNERGVDIRLSARLTASVPCLPPG